MRILTASDHGGFELKSKIIEYLESVDLVDEIEDLGPFELDPDDDYPDFAFVLAEEVAEEEMALGILICRSGNGMAIAANKVRGVRAALCFTPEHAQKAREHNFANVLVLDSDYTSSDENLKIVESFINSSPELGGRHQRRVEKINDYKG